ncbi:MAG: hypothetical protein AAGA68_00410 [Pseudomonadota bacterium]
MTNYVGPAALASVAFFAALGDAWADDFSSALPRETSSRVVSGAPAAGSGAWSINDYVNARKEQPVESIVISTAEGVRPIEEAARSL